MHLLHLVEPWSDARSRPLDRLAGTDAAAQGAAACLATASYHTQAALLIGPRSAEIRARALGIRTFDTVCPINGHSRHGLALLKRVLTHRTSPERTIVWSSHLDSWARELGVPLVYPWTLELAPTAARVTGVRSHIVQRAAIRSTLGIENNAVVIAMADDPPMEADLWMFATVLGMLEIAGVTVTGIAPTSAAHRGRGRRFFRAQGLSQGLLLIDEPIWSCSAAIDIAVVGAGMTQRAREVGELPAASAQEFAWARVMAAERMQMCGVPTVTPDSVAIAPCLHNLLQAPDGRASGLGGKILALAESIEARREAERLLATGVPAHAQSLAARLFWQLTAIPGEVDPATFSEEAMQNG